MDFLFLGNLFIFGQRREFTLMAVTNALIEQKIKSAEEVAALLPRNVTLGCSGFTPAGYPKLIPVAFAKRIEDRKKIRK